jgi:DNA-binding transcriptional LysR family regulator
MLKRLCRSPRVTDKDGLPPARACLGRGTIVCDQLWGDDQSDFTEPISAAAFGTWIDMSTSALPGWSSNSGLPAVSLISIAQALLVAEHLSFRQAARVLGARQSAVSRRVRSLEDTLGVSLFERYHGGVRITAAGARFFDRARSALAQLDHAVKIAGAAGRGENGHLRIGIFSSIAAGFLRHLIRTFREQHPDVALQISEIASRDHLALIRKGRLDVAFVMGTPAVPNCEVLQLWTEQIFVILPQGHALCARKEIEWEAVRDEHFILRHSDPGPAIQDYVIKRLADLGHRPSVQKFDVGRETSVHLVALGLGVSLTSEATIANCFPEVEFRPIGSGTSSGRDASSRPHQPGAGPLQD